MSEPFLGEIRIFSGNFPPLGWAFCDGSLVPINQNTALFSILGTTYGGDGQTTFALPDLRGRVPLHQGQGPGLSDYPLGQSAGAETVTLTVTQMPRHSHALMGSSASQDTDQVTNAALSEGGTYTTHPHDDHEHRHRVVQRWRPGAHQHPALPDAVVHHRAAGHLSHTHMTRTRLRTQRATDEALLRSLFAASLEERLALTTHCAPADRECLLAWQYQAREHGWQKHYPPGHLYIIEIDGTPVGRIRLSRHHPDRTREVVDLAVLPSYRRRGAATAALNAITGPLRLRTAQSNTAALGLYARTGFSVTDSNTLDVVLHRPVPHRRQGPLQK